MLRAIETWYGGLLFRSRLEAKWAAFFDLLGWRFEYEPFDLDGYIPDFALTDAKTKLIVEVKPEVTDAAQRKIERSGWDGDALVVGSSLQPSRDGGVNLGTMGVRTAREASSPVLGSCLEWANGVAQHSGCGCRASLVYEPFGSCRLCGNDADLSRVFVSTDGITLLWRQAANTVRWEPQVAPARSVSKDRCADCGCEVDNNNLGGHGRDRDRNKVFFCARCVARMADDAFEKGHR